MMPAAANLSKVTPVPADAGGPAVPAAAELFAALVAGVGPQQAQQPTDGTVPGEASGAGADVPAQPEHESDPAVVDAAILLPLVEQQRAQMPVPAPEAAQAEGPKPGPTGLSLKGSALTALPADESISAPQTPAPGVVEGDLPSGKSNTAQVPRPPQTGKLSPEVQGSTEQVGAAMSPASVASAAAPPAVHDASTNWLTEGQKARALRRAGSTSGSSADKSAPSGAGKTSIAPSAAGERPAAPAFTAVAKSIATGASTAPAAEALVKDGGDLRTALQSHRMQGGAPAGAVVAEGVAAAVVVAKAGDVTVQPSEPRETDGVATALQQAKAGDLPGPGRAEPLAAATDFIPNKPAAMLSVAGGRADVLVEKEMAATAPSFAERPAAAPLPAAAAALPSAPQPLAAAQAPGLAAALAGQVLDMNRGSVWIDQLARDISRTASGEGPMRFRLAPETLGELRVEISQGERGAHVRLQVTSEAAHQALAEAQPKLAAEARAQGVRIAETEISFTGGETNGREPGRQSQAQPDQPLRTFRHNAGGNAASAAPAEGRQPDGRRNHDRYA
jgi:flagellar hook-length control protein FliK